MSAFVGRRSVFFANVLGDWLRWTSPRWFMTMLNVTLIAHLLSHPFTHTRLTALCPGLPGWAGTRKIKPIWILLKQETVGGSGISWAICTSLQTDNHTSTPPLSFYRPDALPAAQPTASKHWRQLTALTVNWTRSIRSSRYVALRYIGAWPRGLETICPQPITRRMRGLRGPRASSRNIACRQFCRGYFLRHSVRKNKNSELSHVRSHSTRPRPRRRAHPSNPAHRLRCYGP